jgi:1-acyl-sn-glycerol-3-phosphate acyltransferase
LPSYAGTPILKFLNSVILIGLGRLLYFAFYTLLRTAQILLVSAVRGVNIRRSLEIRRSWALHLFRVIGIRRHVRGVPPDFPCIVMGNHRSYLDPVILVADVLGYPVSKAEVAKWPVVGYGARVSGVLFLQRESQQSRKRTLQGIVEKVREGWPVMLFPEGTTHGDPTTREFRAGGFKIAAAEGIPIVPVAIDYRSKEDYWVGDDTFLPHFLRRFSEPEMHVHIHYGPTLRSSDARELLRMTREWIDQELNRIKEL